MQDKKAKTVTLRRHGFIAAIYIAVAVWTSVTTGILLSDILSRREQCDAVLRVFAPSGQEWMRTPTYKQQFAKCAVSKHPVRGYMISKPVFPDLWLTGALFAIPCVGFGSFHLFKRRRSNLRPQKA